MLHIQVNFAFNCRFICLRELSVVQLESDNQSHRERWEDPLQEWDPSFHKNYLRRKVEKLYL